MRKRPEPRTLRLWEGPCSAHEKAEESVPSFFYHTLFRFVPRTGTKSWSGFTVTSLGGSRDRCGAVEFPVFLGVLSRPLLLKSEGALLAPAFASGLQALRESEATAQVSLSLREAIRFLRSVLVVGPETFLQEKVCQDNVGLPPSTESESRGEPCPTTPKDTEMGSESSLAMP